jgi:hypothetical protein
MKTTHALLWTDHQQAEFIKFDATEVQTQKFRSHSHPTGQHGSSVRTEHEFLAQVCAALETVPEVLVAGSHTALADFKHYVEKHKTQAAKHITGYEVVGQLTDKQLVALGRKYFLDRERLAPHGDGAAPA